MQSAVRTGPTHGAVASVASTGAATCSADGRCPALSAQERKARALPDLFLPADGSKSLGYMPLNTPGKGVGVALDGERAGASFKTQELMDHLYGGSKSLARRRMLLAALENDPVMRKWDGIFQSRSERLRRAREKGAALVEHMKRLGVTDGTEISLMSSHLGDLLPSDLHRSMFVPTLLSQASDEQQKEWLGPAQDFKILGTYVQTELGHGSFVRGLETTATFDPSTDEFVCHSPTLTATKWWPGNLGQVTTHCILMAKLVSNGVDHGVHAFLMPLRDPKNGLAVLPGRTIGDIGPKVGYESNDNGFARFDHVRIPRSYLMARYVRVNRDGSYERLGHPKAAYATMVFVRSQIVIYAARYLTMGLTIAIRYSAVRRQFPDPASGKGASGVNAEMAVLNYQPQQHTLFTLLATAFAFHYSGLRMRRLYEQNKANLAKGDASLLAELHATSSGLKAYTTTVTSEGLEATRKCCGGHGYSRMCGISDIWVDYVPAQTYEGDNVVMFLQTARALVKSFGAVQKGKFKPRETSQLAYMAEALAMQKAGGEAAIAASGARSGLTAEHLRGGVENGEALDTQLRALFAHRAARLLVVAVEELAESGKARPEWNGEQHWEACKIALVAAARSHCQNVLLLNFLDALKRFQSPDAKHAPSAQLQKVLRRLSDLHALSIIEKELGDFSVDGYLSLAQARLVRRRIVSLLSEIRPDAVALVDSFDYSDWFLNSALGRFDGDVYTTMWEWAQRNPLNDRQANGKGPGIDEFIMPMLEAKAKL